MPSANRDPGFYQRLSALALPIILQNLISTSLGFADTFMVGLLSSDALSAVAAANALLFLLQTAIFGLTSGLSVLVSQYWGRQDLRAISRCLGVVLYAGGSVVGLCVLLLLLFPHGAMALVTNDSLLIQIGVGYLRITAGGYLCSLLSAVYVSLEQSTGNPKSGTIILSISVALNTALNYCLIFGKLGFPAWGITGAAAATLIARVSEVCMVLFFICKQRRFPLYPAELFRPGLFTLRLFLRYSLLILFNEFMWALGQSVFTSILGHASASADLLAAFAVISSIDKLAMVACYGLADAAAILLGHWLGQGAEKENIYRLGCRLLRIAALLGALLGAVLGILLPVLLRPVLFPLFHLSAYAVSAASWMCLFYLLQLPCRSFNNAAITGVFRSGGDIRGAIAVDLIPLWLVAIPLTAFLVFVVQVPLPVICLGIYCENVCKMPLGILRLRSRKWLRTLPANLTKQGDSAI